MNVIPLQTPQIFDWLEPQEQVPIFSHCVRMRPPAQRKLRHTGQNSFESDSENEGLCLNSCDRSDAKASGIILSKALLYPCLF